MKTTICGIPVKIQYLDQIDQTLVHPRFGSLSRIQRDLISTWLEHKGNLIVAGNWSYIPVKGTLAPKTLLNNIEPQ